MAHVCARIIGTAADRLAAALADPSVAGAGAARTLASETAYRALVTARADLCDALDALCVPAPPWTGGGGDPADLRGAALGLSGALAADRADPAGRHDQAGRGWLATGQADPAAVSAARRLLIVVERAVSGS